MAAPFMMEARLHRLTGAYGDFTCHEFRPASGGRGFATALVVHGWGSRGEHMRRIIEGLLERGMRVMALDLPGHGASPGRSLHMAAAVAAVETVEQWFAPLSVMIGHSFGGAVVVNAAVGSIRGIRPVPARRLVLVSTPNSMPGLFAAFARFCGLGRRTREFFTARVEQVTGHPLSSFETARQLAGLSLPVLVLHAPDDREVPAADADLIAAAGPHVERRWIPGAGHRRILSDPRAVAAACDFASGRPLSPFTADEPAEVPFTTS